MAVKSSASITVSWERDITSVTWYYKLQASTASPPAKPTTATPSGWTTTEPTYTEGSTNNLYVTQKTTFTDSTFEYSDVSLSSSYEAAKIAYNESQAAKRIANNYLSMDSTGIMVADMTDGTVETPSQATGRNVFIDSDSVDIRDGQNVLASFGETVQMGDTGQSHLMEDYHSLRLVDKEGDTYFHVSDLRDEDGYAQITEYFTGDGSTTDFIVTLSITSVYGQHGCSAAVDDVACTIDTDFVVSTAYKRFRFTTAPSDGAQIAVTYYTTSQDAKAYTLGKRLSSSTVGPYSLAEGKNCTASGWTSHAEGHLTVASSSSAHAEGEASEATGGNSHAEGWHSKASGNYSHAEGYNAKAKGMYSHAEGYETVASGNNSHAQGHVTEAAGNNQTVIGKYNVKDTANKYALIIGNGTSASAKSNGLTVDWDGNLKTAGAVNGIKVIANNYYDRDSGQTKTFTLTTLCGYMLYIYRYNTTSGNGMYIISAHTSATAIDAVKSTSNVTVTASGLTLNVKLNSNYVQLVLVKMTA